VGTYLSLSLSLSQTEACDFTMPCKPVQVAPTLAVQALRTPAKGHARRQAFERLSAGWRVPAEPGLDNTKYGRIFNIILIRIIRNTWSSQV